MSTALIAGPVGLDVSLAAVFAKTSPSFAEQFYGALFHRYPEYRSLFAAKDMVFQSSMLTLALQTLVEWYRRPSILARQYLRLLGQKHHSMGIAAKDYDHFFLVLSDELARLHGSKWTSSLADQWQAAFQRGVEAMLEGDSGDTKKLHIKQFAMTAGIIQGLNIRVEQASRLFAATQHVNQGVVMDDVLEKVYEDFKGLIPYNRIGLALIDDACGAVVVRWEKSDRRIHLGRGYEGKLAGSTLAQIVKTGLPRVINDLDEYLEKNPNSHSTRLVVQEGMKSSLTCPLVARGKPVGFLFFSSTDKNTYKDAHVELLQSIAGQLSIIVDKAWLYSQLQQQATVIEDQNRRLTRELEMARTFQKSMIPIHDIEVPGLAIEFFYEPAIHVGGDFLDIVALEDDRTLIFVADVAGHGVDAAMMAAAVKAAWNNARRISDNPADILRTINVEVCGFADGRFVTALCALLDPMQHELQLARAGHPSPWHYHSLRKSVSRNGQGALPLGVDAAVEYEASCYPLEVGDALVLATDGILEAVNDAGEQFGEERLNRLIAKHGTANAGELLQRIRRDLSLHVGDKPLEDDLTVIVVQVRD
jgi:serine phosphatase RsbU (regulator of sigma subunit)/hemoglobin-like flavoprotein